MLYTQVVISDVDVSCHMRRRIHACHLRRRRTHFMLYTQVVISDVDGTITKSDLLGHVMPTFGFQWAQKGVAQLLTRIQVSNDMHVSFSSYANG
jgi:hypothetical protein